MVYGIGLAIGFAGVFVLLEKVLRTITPKTTKQIQIYKDDPRKGSAVYARQLACMISAIHGAITSIVCILIVLKEGVHYNEPSSPAHNWAIAVTLKFMLSKLLV
jgi:hypothetical protein